MSCPQEMASSSADSAVNVRATLLMHAGTTTADDLDRARKATE